MFSSWLRMQSIQYFEIKTHKAGVTKKHFVTFSFTHISVIYCHFFCPIETFGGYTEKIPAANQGEREEALGAERGCGDSQGEFWEEEEELLVLDSSISQWVPLKLSRLCEQQWELIVMCVLQRSAQTAVEDSERIFTELISSIEKRRSEVTQMIRDREKTVVNRAEGLLEKLKQEIDDLRRRNAELEQLSDTHDHIHFLQVASWPLLLILLNSLAVLVNEIFIFWLFIFVSL